MHYKELNDAWKELTAPGAPFEVEVKVIGGVPLRCYKNAPPTARDVWFATRAFADRTYLVYQNERISYAEAHRLTAAIANWLLARGVKPGERVAIAMRNYPEWMLIYWACVSVGITVVGMNAWWTSEELAYVFSDAMPKVAFCDGERLNRVAERPDMLDDVTLVSVRTEPGANAVPWVEVIEDQKRAMPEVPIDPDADACIFYTSGTTGFPKGAQLTHRGCVSNLMNMLFAARVQALATLRGTGAGTELPEAPPPTTLITTPFFHVTANNCGAYTTTALGGTMVLMYRWDAGEALKLIEREKVTGMSGVPVMSRELLAHPDFKKTNTSSLASLGGGGAPLLPDLVAAIDNETTAAQPTTGYGMTETCGIISAISGEFFVDRPKSVGRAMPNYEAKCVDDAGHEVPPGEPGELWVRGSSVVKGYINRPEATAEAITDGWMHTGDVARIEPDGFIYVVDRKKDMVLRGGENVYCAEVEGAIHRHPAVAECSVFGVPDTRLGEEVAAAVVVRPGHTLSAAALREHCAANIAKHKIPRYIWIRTEGLPRNASGKFLKRQLRDTLKLADAQ